MTVRNLLGETSTVVGNGDRTLTGTPLDNARLFSAGMSAGDTVRASIVDRTTGDTEVGIYIYRTGPSRLEVSSIVLAFGPNSSGETSPVSFLAGTKDIFSVADAASIQPVNANLTALAGLTGAADRVPYFTALATMALATLTSFGRSLIAAVDAAAARVVLNVPGARGPGDNWTHIDAGEYGIGANPFPVPFVLNLLGSGTIIAPAVDLAHLASSAWEIRCNAASSNSGAVIFAGTTTDRYRLRPGLLMRTRIVPKTIDAAQRRSCGWTNAAITSGVYFDFTGGTVVGVINNVGVTTTLPTLAVDTAYVLELEINAAGDAVSFRVRNGITNAVIAAETHAYTLTTTLYRPIAHRCVYGTNPGIITAIDQVLDLGYGNRPGYDAWRGSSA